MKKAVSLGILSSFFFAFTFIINRQMQLTGGSWIWSGALRYLFTLPMAALLLAFLGDFSRVHREIRKAPLSWILWSTVGFGLFYAPMAYAGSQGVSWLVAASWQITIVMGILLTPLFGHPIPRKQLALSTLILLGVGLLQIQNLETTSNSAVWKILLPIVIGAVAYPLGNRKMMERAGDLSTLERTYGMTLCSMPFWLLLSVYGLNKVGIPSGQQMLQAGLVAWFSGIIATILFFKGTDLVKTNPRQIAAVESTQAGEVLFTLMGGIWFLGDPLPDLWGGLGLILIITGMMGNAFISAKKPES